MKEANSPVDINKDQIKKYQKGIEDNLAGFQYGTSKYNIPGMIRSIDEAEPETMSQLETSVYITMREGMQIFRAVGEYVGDKVGVKDRLLKVDSSSIMTDPELLKLQDFTNSFAAYAASTYITKKVDNLIATLAPDADISKDRPDLSMLKLNTAVSYSGVINQLITPIANGLMNHHKDDKKAFFKSETDLPAFIRDVYHQYAAIAQEKKSGFDAKLLSEVENYTFRIMDDFVSLQGFEDKSIARISVKDKSTKSFSPIDPNSIVGNELAKEKIYRYAQRLVLYDPVKQMNPIMDLGGLTWSAIMDGPPGTGKTSMLRMFMTLLDQYAGQLGLDYNIIMIDQSIKDEFYGKTGKILYEKLAPTSDLTKICGVIFEDIDLLTSKRSDAQGADNDINNIIMQYLDGAKTPKTTGKIINFASTNKATGLDDAMRNRYNDRLYVDGPVDPEDFADVGFMALKKLMTQGLAKMELGKGYVPMATQKIFTMATEAQVKDAMKHRSERVAEEFSKKYKSASIKEFGQFMADAKKINNGITGRSMNAVMEAIKERSADFDVPSEWLSDRSRFVDQPYDKKISLLKELYTPITPDMLFEEAQRYIDSEARYAKKDAEEAVAKGYNEYVSGIQSRIKFLKEELDNGAKSRSSELFELQTMYQIYQENVAAKIKTEVDGVGKKNEKKE